MELISIPALLASANLQAYYRFNNGARTTDTSANARTLTEVGSPTSTINGQYGYGAVTSSAGDYFTRANSTTTDLMGLGHGPFTLTGWFRRSAEISSGQEGMLDWIRWDGTNVSNTQLAYLYNSGTFQLELKRDASGGVVIQTANQTLGIRAHHIAVVLDTTLTLYVDGVNVLSFTSSNNGRSGGNSNTLYFCFTSSNGAGSFMIDDVACFNRALTAAEILALSRSDAQGFIS